MDNYCLNKIPQAGGHVVHRSECRWLPSPKNQIDLGVLDSDTSAIIEARRHRGRVNGCYFCLQARYNS